MIIVCVCVCVQELVSLVLKDLRSQWGVKTLRCLEVGCGSGAISLSLLHSVPQVSLGSLCFDHFSCTCSFTEVVTFTVKLKHL